MKIHIKDVNWRRLLAWPLWAVFLWNTRCSKKEPGAKQDHRLGFGFLPELLPNSNTVKRKQARKRRSPGNTCTAFLLTLGHTATGRTRTEHIPGGSPVLRLLLVHPLLAFLEEADRSLWLLHEAVDVDFKVLVLAQLSQLLVVVILTQYKPQVLIRVR